MKGGGGAGDQTARGNVAEMAVWVASKPPKHVRSVCRAKTTLRLKFEVCKELSKHMELLPKTGYIQAQSSFSVQLKFLPR